MSDPDATPLDADTADEYFESMYRDRDDPWAFDSSPYEQRKFDLTVASLTRTRYRHGFEPGCANGALTERLAERCEQTTGYDIVAATVERARRRFGDRPDVTIAVGRLPDDWPDDDVDLVVWSEIAYYLSSTSLSVALERLDDALSDDGELVVVGYTGETNAPLTALDVERLVERSGWLTLHTTVVSDGFRITVWTRSAPVRSEPDRLDGSAR